MFLQFLLGIVRHCLTYGGGLLTAQGLGSANDWDQVVGAVITILGIAWSVWDKRKRGLTKAGGEAAPIGTTEK